MFKKHPKIKYTLITLLVIVFLIVSFGYWFFSLLPAKGSLPNLEKTTTAELPYLHSDIDTSRGKVLMVVTSTDMMGSTDKSTGYELTELARPYYVFMANGLAVDIASPQGGQPPVVIDNDDMAEYDYAFLNDPSGQQKVNNTIAIQDLDPQDYEAVFFVGGKGAMYDFPDNKHLQSLTAYLYENQKVIGAVCHGPAALVNVKLSDGSLLINEKGVSGFTNEEELFLISNAREIFPFLLEDKLSSQGAQFNKTSKYLQQVSIDGKLVTGQNPWSTWLTAESVVKQMGYELKYRKTSPQENSIKIITTYEQNGRKVASEQLTTLMEEDILSVDRYLLAQHCVVGLMQFQLGKTKDLLTILRKAKLMARGH